MRRDATDERVEELEKRCTGWRGSREMVDSLG